METLADRRWDVRFEPDERLLVLRSRDGRVALRASCSLEVSGQRLTPAEAAQVSVTTAADGEQPATIALVFRTLAGGAGILSSQTEPEIQWTLSVALSDDGATVETTSQIANCMPYPISLGRCSLLDIAPGCGRVELVGDDGSAVFLQTTGSTDRALVRRAADGKGEKWSRTLLHLVSHAAGRALHLGFITFDRQTTVHTFTYEAGSGLTSLQSTCDFEGYELPAGETVRSETLMVEAREDFHASLHEWADRAARHYQPRIWPKTPAGWVGWSWVDGFNVECYEDVVIRNVRAIRRRLAGFDIEYVWVSIGNLKDGLPGDWLGWDFRNFPHGHEWLIAQLGELGFRLGLWCGAFWMCGALTEKVGELRDAMLRRGGEPVVASPRWDYGASGLLEPEERPCLYSLDPTHPKTLAHLRHVFQTYREWGIRYYMVDFLNAVSGATPGHVPYDAYHDKSVIKGPEVLRTGLREIREAAGPDTYLLSSSGPTLQNVGYVDACRVGSDYGEGRALSPDSHFYPATFVINSPDFWTSHNYASDNMAATYFTHRKLYLNDSGNVMTLDKPMPLCEAQIVATIFGLSGGPVMLGDDIDRIAEERLALIKKVFPRTPDVAKPVDLFDSPYPDYPKVFHQHVKTEWDEWDVIGVLNYGDEPLVAPIALDRLVRVAPILFS